MCCLLIIFFKYIFRTACWENVQFQSQRFMMYETQLGSKTQLGTYIGNHKFRFSLPGNTTQCQPLPSKHPGLAAMSQFTSTLSDLRTRLRLRPRAKAPKSGPTVISAPTSYFAKNNSSGHCRHACLYIRGFRGRKEVTLQHI